MTIKLDKDTEERLLTSLQRYCAQNFDDDIGSLKARLLHPQTDSLLTPQNSVLAMIDYQSEQYAGVGSVGHDELRFPRSTHRARATRCTSWPTPSAASAGSRMNLQCNA